ncbi:MAG TPA: VIT domain-containing protein [Gemmataceae bacterium]|nr:VIT domain-containing protein [Gemmataceae bacterium]
MRCLLALGLLLVGLSSARADGIMIPKERSMPPLALVNHHVQITLHDQVAVTHVEQTFRNSTNQMLEATYLFPVPNGASVTKFSMWVNGKEMTGELLDAPKARQIYNDIVRRTKDPGLLEYVDNNVFRLSVFPVQPRSDQKVSLTYSSVLTRDNGIVEFVYPLKAGSGPGQGHALEEFSIEASIKSPDPIQNVFSPTHAITVTHKGDREVTVKFDRNQGFLDKDFQLFYACSPKDVSFTTLTFRPNSSRPGYVLMLIAPRMESKSNEAIPRDMVFVLDTSGSMQGAKMDQARRALKFCLKNLGPKDRFGLLHFATTVDKYRDGLEESSADRTAEACRWVDGLDATGGTNIQDALAAALDYRSSDPSRGFTIVFFTDGMPTIGETNPERILKGFLDKNTANTRVFTFGVGDDVNATFLDQLASQTRAVSTYVRPAEDIEEKVSGLYAKISLPVMTDLKLSASGGVHLEEMFPPRLPDLFHGSQLVVLGRYSGSGPAAISLTGRVGSQQKEIVNESTFPETTGDAKAFIEQIWARRKVGYLLDQIRQHGETRELVDETKTLAKRYGIATPYTSYLIVPDGPMPVTRRRFGGGTDQGSGGFGGGGIGGGIGGIGGGIGGTPGSGSISSGSGSGGAAGLSMLRGAPSAGKPASGPLPGLGKGNVADFAKDAQQNKGDLSDNRDKLNSAYFSLQPASGAGSSGYGTMLREAGEKRANFEEAKKALSAHRLEQVQEGKLGVELSLDSSGLRNQSRLTQTAVRNVAGRNCLEYAGVWIDEGFDAKTPTVTVKAQSDAYFRLLERQPQLREVFKLGNCLVWMTPSGTALVIDPNEGTEKLGESEIDGLFKAKK